MKPALAYLPPLVTLLLCGALLAYGPIPQPEHYHAFADRSVFMGVPHAADVLSNIGFALVGIWGLLRLWPQRRHAGLQRGWPGYVLFLLALLLTACGSVYYHLAPDDARLVWDRLPIALACVGLLAAVRAENVPGVDASATASFLALPAIASVGWWYFTAQAGEGDLRPYLLVQGLPLVLIPLWQAIYGAPRSDRLIFGAAVLLYVLAKFAELNDHALLAVVGVVSGHTIKHLLATAAAWLLVAGLVHRVRMSNAVTPSADHCSESRNRPTVSAYSSGSSS